MLAGRIISFLPILIVYLFFSVIVGKGETKIFWILIKTSSIGQWSEPMTSLKILLDLSLGLKEGDMQK